VITADAWFSEKEQEVHLINDMKLSIHWILSSPTDDKWKLYGRGMAS
jgi:hypothetical protein